MGLDGTTLGKEMLAPPRPPPVAPMMPAQAQVRYMPQRYMDVAGVSSPFGNLAANKVELQAEDRLLKEAVVAEEKEIEFIKGEEKEAAALPQDSKYVKDIEKGLKKKEKELESTVQAQIAEEKSIESKLYVQPSTQGVSMSALALVGLAVGSGVTFAIFRSRRVTLSEAREPLATA
jgi:hypothetical protein